MDFQTKLQNYADLVIRSGCNLQKGQELFLRSPIDCADFARLLVKAAYSAGAKDVTVFWSDEKVSRIRYENSGMEVFEQVPDWYSALYNGMTGRDAAVLSIYSEDPEAFADVDAHKPAAWAKATHAACKPFHDDLDMGRTAWCIVSAPCDAWAKKVFPGCSAEEATEKLWDAIFKAVRADCPDPVEAWNKHRKSFEQRIAWLNGQHFDRLHYKNAIGTDITIGLPVDYAWAGGGDRTVRDVFFFPNMPTEEIFCSPDKNRADGTVHSALPLIHNGSLIDHFSLTFEKGRVVSFAAEKGYDTLKEIIETDEGARHLGEAALIPAKSPLSEMGILFYNTLYDENASCHFAIGRGFPECIQGGREMDEKTLEQKGINDSATHVDFMLGTPDLAITGILSDNTEVPIFRDGNWAF